MQIKAVSGVKVSLYPLDKLTALYVKKVFVFRLEKVPAEQNHFSAIVTFIQIFPLVSQSDTINEEKIRSHRHLNLHHTTTLPNLNQAARQHPSHHLQLVMNNQK